MLNILGLRTLSGSVFWSSGSKTCGDDGVVLLEVESVSKVVSHKSIPAQIRQLVLDISYDKGYVDGFVRELTFAKRPHKHFLSLKVDEQVQASIFQLKLLFLDP